MACTVVESSFNHIDVSMLNNNMQYWRLTCFYEFPNRTRRRESWEFIRSLASRSSLPWIIYGDFNDILCSADKMGIHPHPQMLLDGFRTAIKDSALIEVELTDGNYT